MKISPTEQTVRQAGIASSTNAIGGTGVSGTASPGRALISGAVGATWEENVQRISVGATAALGPFVAFAAASNVSVSVSSNTVTYGAVTPTVRIAAGVPSGAPTGTELPLAADTTAVTGGAYAWNGSAWVKISTI